MSKGLAMRKMRALIIVTITVGIGFQIINSLNESTDQNKVDIKSIYPVIDYPFCSDFETGEEITQKEFNKLIFYRLEGNCDIPEQRVKLDFVLENKSLKSEARRIGLKDSDGDLYVYNRKNCTEAENLNLKGIKIGENNQRILFQKDEEIKMKGTGGEVTIC